METQKYSPNWYWGKAKCQIIRLPIKNYPGIDNRLIIDHDNKFVCFKAGFEKEIVLAIKIIRENKWSRI